MSEKIFLRITKGIFIVKWRFDLYYKNFKENLPFILENIETPFKEKYDYYLLDTSDKEFLVFCHHKIKSKIILRTAYRFHYQKKAIIEVRYLASIDWLQLNQKVEFDELIKEKLFDLLPIIKKYFAAISLRGGDYYDLFSR